MDLLELAREGADKAYIIRMLVVYACVGGLGAMCRELVLNRNVILLPSLWRENGKAGLDLGIMGSLIVGVSVAVIVNGSVSAAFLSAVGAPHLIEECIKKYRTWEMEREE